MRLADEVALARLAAHDHGVLCTWHPSRGVDAVPVVFAVDGEGFVGVPIDRVKPKAAGPMQRERNLAADPRATLLVEHWDADDWSALWWVRAELQWAPDTGPDHERDLTLRLMERYRQYREHADPPFDRVLVLQLVGITGWAASGA